MKALVIGGAGYIGGTTSLLLSEGGHDVLILDDFSTGHKTYVSGMKSECYNLLNYEKLSATMSAFKPDVVFHFAAKIQVAESMHLPDEYYENNTYGTMKVLKAMSENGVTNIVFSSTAAVYGQPDKTPIHEDSAKLPISPYGLSKYMSEQIIDSYGYAKHFNWATFRYFNAAGAYKNRAMDYPVMTHLIPHATEAALGHKTLQIFGNDYNTPDGTCVRDFVHVVDIARAHVLAAELMQSGTTLKTAMNLGSSSGYSVLDVINTMKAVTGADVPYTIERRRAGDPAILIADSHRAQSLLGWSADLGLKEMIHSHYTWRVAQSL